MKELIVVTKINAIKN